MNVEIQDDHNNNSNSESQLIQQQRNTNHQNSTDLMTFNQISQLQEQLNNKLIEIENKISMNTTQTNILATRMDTIETTTVQIATNLIEKQNQYFSLLLSGFLAEQKQINNQNNQNRNSN
jgi:hypothetical protein